MTDKLAGLILQWCPQCKGRASECRKCWDAGFVVHGPQCEPIPADADTVKALRELWYPK